MIETKIIDYMGNETIMRSECLIDKEKKVISYRDDDVEVCVIISDKIVMKRSGKNYQLELIFEENMINSSKYEIANPDMTLDVEVKTLSLKRKNNNFYVEYMLKLNEEEIGLFCVDFKVEE